MISTGSRRRWQDQRVAPPRRSAELPGCGRPWGPARTYPDAARSPRPHISVHVLAAGMPSIIVVPRTPPQITGPGRNATGPGDDVSQRLLETPAIRRLVGVELHHEPPPPSNGPHDYPRPPCDLIGPSPYAVHSSIAILTIVSENWFSLFLIIWLGAWWCGARARAATVQGAADLLHRWLQRAKRSISFSTNQLIRNRRSAWPHPTTLSSLARPTRRLRAAEVGLGAHSCSSRPSSRAAAFSSSSDLRACPLFAQSCRRVLRFSRVLEVLGVDLVPRLSGLAATACRPDFGSTITNSGASVSPPAARLLVVAAVFLRPPDRPSLISRASRLTPYPPFHPATTP